MPQQATLEVRLDAAGSDAEELADLTAKLRQELLRLDVDAVDRAVAGEPPPGAKALDAVAIGTLLVTLGKTAGVLGSVVRTVQSWLGPVRTVKLELDGDAIEITGVSSRDQQRLIDLWIERHAEAHE
jgi:hypothetical protein